MICHWSSLIRQSCHFERDFDHVLLQLVDILNTQFKYREGSWHSSLKRLNCWRKSCAKFDSLLLNIQDATARSLEKWTLKFKLLYLLKHICYFNKICRPSSVNAVNLVKKLLQFQRYRIFPRDYFFGAPCIIQGGPKCKPPSFCHNFIKYDCAGETSYRCGGVKHREEVVNLSLGGSAQKGLGARLTFRERSSCQLRSSGKIGKNVFNLFSTISATQTVHTPCRGGSTGEGRGAAAPQ